MEADDGNRPDRLAILGPPGAGKTFELQRLLHNGGQYVMTASTHLAVEALGPSARTFASFLMCAKRKAFVEAQFVPDANGLKPYLVIDEFTMLSRTDLEQALRWQVPLLLCGDFGQLCSFKDPISRAWLEEYGFVIRELTENRRAADDRTRAVYAEARGLDTDALVALCVRAGVPRIGRNSVPFPAAGARSHYIVSLNENVRLMNDRYLRALHAAAAPGHTTAPGAEYVWGNENRGLIYGPVTIGALVIGIDTLKGTKALPATYKNQEIGFVAGLPREVPKRGQCVRVVSTQNNRAIDVPLSYLHPGFAITYHRCQGQTFDFPIYADISNLFERAMLYVAVTRVRVLENLWLVAWDGDAPADVGAAAPVMNLTRPEWLPDTLSARELTEPAPVPAAAAAPSRPRYTRAPTFEIEDLFNDEAPVLPAQAPQMSWEAFESALAEEAVAAALNE